MATKLPPHPTTANERLMALLVAHQIGLLRFSGYVSSRVIALLNRSEQDLADKIRSRLGNNSGLITTAELRRYQAVVDSLTAIRTTAWAAAREELLKQLVDELPASELSYINQAVVTTSPVVLQTALPAVSQLKRIALSRPFQGRILRDWAAKIEADDLANIRAQIQAGMVAGESSATIARRVVGTARLRGADGVTEITRRQAQSITRTAVNHIATAVRNEFFLENDDVFDEEQFLATLDSRTTLVCASNDGKRFPIGKGPMPPLHYGCRSLRVPAFDGDVLSNRPAKNITEQQVLREYNQANGTLATRRQDLPRGHKTKFDAFKRARVREMTGTVPGSTTYEQFLRGQSAQFQNDVLGVTKAKLFREGGLSLDRFVARNGSELNLSQLARLDAEAFKAAGLDPANFL